MGFRHLGETPMGFRIDAVFRNVLPLVRSDVRAMALGEMRSR